MSCCEPAHHYCWVARRMPEFKTSMPQSCAHKHVSDINLFNCKVPEIAQVGDQILLAVSAHRVLYRGRWMDTVSTVGCPGSIPYIIKRSNLIGAIVMCETSQVCYERGLPSIIGAVWNRGAGWIYTFENTYFCRRRAHLRF